jgi:hypothetical protein
MITKEAKLKEFKLHQWDWSDGRIFISDPKEYEALVRIISKAKTDSAAKCAKEFYSKPVLVDYHGERGEE